MVANGIYDDLAEFFASLAPEKVIRYTPPAAKQQRLSELLALQQQAQLNKSEREELEHYFTLERIIRLAKAHALTLLKRQLV